MTGGHGPLVLLAALLCAAFASQVEGAAAEAPDWLESAGKRPIPAFATKPSVVVLLEEEMVDVSKSEARSRVREAVKYLTAEGLRGATLLAGQRINQDFKLIAGWRMRPDGAVTRYDTKSISQVDADDSYEFSMSKLNVFKPDDARVGDIIAWEYVLKSKPESHQTGWGYGGPSPTLLSRFGLKMPSDWRVSTAMKNHEEISPRMNEDGFKVWEMREIPATKMEPLGLPLRDLAPVLLVRYGPPPGTPDPRRFDDWESVGRWYAGIFRPQVVADDEVRATASQLAAGAASKLEAIRSVARFVQGVRYLNVAIGRGMAEPHPAPQILRNRFGDCEDKSVLTVTLLREIGVDAYPVQALTSDAGEVPEDFPAPNPFNHVIVAIKAPLDVDLPSIIEAGPLGRLILFDPTSTDTGLGDLPYYLQGTRGVVSSAEHSGFVTLPILPPEASGREGEIGVGFAGGGGLDVRARITYTGQYAARERAHYESVRGEKRKEQFASSLSAQYGKAEIRSFDVSGVERPGDDIVLAVEFWMTLPGKDLGSLRTLAAHFLQGTRAPRLADSERATPLRLEAGYRERDRTTILVPAEWRPLEPLPAADAQSPVGRYQVRSRVEDGKLIVERTLEVKAATIPPAQYAPIKRFFDEVMKGDAAGIAFEKGSPPGL